MPRNNIAIVFLAAIVFNVFILLAARIVFPIVPVFAHSSLVIITMSQDGFEPQETTVDINATVRFVNKDDVDRWPASNLHPTHTIYPAFDPKKPIPPGESWDFRPDKVGSWKYHDHLSPHLRGTLVVTGESTGSSLSLAPAGTGPTQTVTVKSSLFFDVPNLLTTLKNTILRVLSLVRARIFSSVRPVPNGETFRALPQKEQLEDLRQISDEKGPEAAWKFVVTTYTDAAGANQSSGSAHDLAHFVGSLIYQRVGVNGLHICDPSFAFGCFHGFTEAAFTERLDLLSDIATGCTKIGTIGSGPWASCIHGIGHGIATYYDTTSLKESLEACDRLREGQPFCWDGVFMEFSINAPGNFWKDHVTAPNGEEDPRLLCTNIAPQYRSACARSLPPLLSMRRSMNDRQVAISCLEVQDQAITYSCIDALGLRIGQESSGNVNTVMSRCTAMPTEQTYAHCATAAAGELIFQNYPNWEVSSSQICSAIPETYRDSCHERTRQLTKDYRQKT